MKDGLNIFSGTLETAGFSNDFFDVIHISHVLEHLPDPTQTLKMCNRILKDDGVLLIEVPYEFYNIVTKWEKAIKRNFKQRDTVRVHHSYYFSVRTLKELMDKCGFRGKIYTRTPFESKTNALFKLIKWLCVRTGDYMNMGTNIVVMASKINTE